MARNSVDFAIISWPHRARILAVYLHRDSSEDLQLKAKRALKLDLSHAEVWQNPQNFVSQRFCGREFG
jgi:hypothetical protein